MDDHTMTVTNEDLQRQMNDQRADNAEINLKLEKLIELSTGQQLQGQALAELQKQFGTYLDRYSTNDIKQWEDINATKEALTSLKSKIHGGAIVLGFFQVLIVGMIGWTLETVISDHTMIAVHESKLTEQGGELQALRHLTGN
jgi:ferric iron reductase protein FhuF